MTAIHYAASAGCQDVLEPLAAMGADPTILNKSGMNALHVAVHAGFTGCVELLINRLNVNPNTLTLSQIRSNLLHIACKKGNADMAHFLIHRTRMNLRQLTAQGDDALFLAVRGNDFPLVRHMVYLTVEGLIPS